MYNYTNKDIKHIESMQSVLNKPFTDELKELKRKEDEFFSKYIKLSKDKARQLYLYNQTIFDPSKKLEDSYFKPIDITDTNIPEEVRTICRKERQAHEEYTLTCNKYTELLNRNILQLVYEITPENSMTVLKYECGSKEIFTEYRDSWKPFLIFVTAAGYLIIVHGNQLKTAYDKYGIPLYQVNDQKHYYNKSSMNREFFDDINNLKSQYKDYLFPNPYSNPPKIAPTPIPLSKPYTLQAQSFHDDYGRTDQYLIIGFMIYRPNKN